jgi:hypothetical protein
MSREELEKYKPDSAKEFSFFGSSLVRLSSAVSGGLILSDHAIWAIASILLTWAGHEIEQYFKLHEPAEKKPENEQK